MHTKRSPFTQAKLDIDNRLLQQLAGLGIATDKAALSRALGKNATYFACMRNRHYGVHVGSLAFLQARLSREMEETDNIKTRARLRTAISAINEAIQEKCKLRELELLS